MKNFLPKNKNTFSVALLAAVFSGGLLASTPPQLTDTDGDGVISAEEILQLREQHKSAMVSEYDTDGDGELSKEERKAMKEARRAQWVAEHDTNGDGELSRAERRAAKQARRDSIEAQLDVNQDGVVSDAEGAGFDEVKKNRKGRRHGKHSDGQRQDRATRNNNADDTSNNDI